MNHANAEAGSTEKWVLIRRARQLLTLRGPSGPRRGSALKELGIIADGAVLIRNGLVVDVGPSRRVENLAGAKSARVIDASGKILMPAFVDPDAVLIFPQPGFKPGPNARSDHPAEASLKTVSTKVLEGRGSAAAADLARHGVLSVGAHSGHALELREALKTLRVHGVLQAKPLRIRSILALRMPPGLHRDRTVLLNQVVEKWLPTVQARKLASILEVTADDEGCALGFEGARVALVAAAKLGFSIGLRCTSMPTRSALELAREAGALSVVGPMLEPFATAASDCLHVLTAVHGCGGRDWDTSGVRRAIDGGCLLALGSGYRPLEPSSLNPQFTIHSATVRLGMEVEEAITASTWNAACALRMSQSAGSIEPGKPADVLLLDAPDYRELSRRVGHNDVAAVMRAGHVVHKRGTVG